MFSAVDQEGRFVNEREVIDGAALLTYITLLSSPLHVD
jgi:hypothetical protein